MTPAEMPPAEVPPAEVPPAGMAPAGEARFAGWFTERAGRAVLLVAIAIFIVLGFTQSSTFMVWAEEPMVHAAAAQRALAPRLGDDGLPRLEPSCEEGRAHFVWSARRPVLRLCHGGRAYPVLIARYYAGVFYWPFALLEPFHHDSVLGLRKCALSIGILSLILTYFAIERLAGPMAAAAAAIGVATNPCFVLLHATLEHFEGTPWLFMMAAIIVLARSRALVKGAAETSVPTGRLVAAGFLVGLSVLANFKAVVILAAFALVALRFGVQFRRIRPAQWAAVVLAAALPVAPMLAAMPVATSAGYSDQSSGWTRTLLANIRDVGGLVRGVPDLLYFWSNVGHYLGRIGGGAPLDVVPFGVAIAVFGFTLVAGGRALIRGRGDLLTAACAAAMLAMIVFVALMDDSYPINFTPLHAVFGVAVASAALQLGRLLAVRSPRPAVAAAPLVLLTLPFAGDTVKTTLSMRDLHAFTNVAVEREMVDHLVSHPHPERPIYVGTPQLEDVIDSLSEGRVRTTAAFSYFRACDELSQRDRAGGERCAVERWRALLRQAGGSPIRVLVPSANRFFKKRLSLLPTLEAAAAESGYRVELERAVNYRDGEAAILLYDVAPRPAGP